MDENGEWELFNSPDGYPYYFNRQTGESQWANYDEYQNNTGYEGNYEDYDQSYQDSGQPYQDYAGTENMKTGHYEESAEGTATDETWNEGTESESKAEVSYWSCFVIFLNYITFFLLFS